MYQGQCAYLKFRDWEEVEGVGSVVKVCLECVIPTN